MRTFATRSIVARAPVRGACAVAATLLVIGATTVGCLGHAGDAERLRSHPAVNESARPSNEPMPASVDPGGYGEEYPERRR
jgi:hypothetical protein